MRVSKKIRSCFVFLVCAAASFISCDTGSKEIVVNPVEIDSTLLNPGRGFTSTGNSSNENFGTKLHPLSGIHQQLAG